MDTILTKWGNSLGVRIPQALLRQLGLREGTRLNLRSYKGKLVIEPALEDLNALVARISPDHIHEEMDFGKAQGREEW